MMLLVGSITVAYSSENRCRCFQSAYWGRVYFDTANSIIIRSDMQGRIQYLNDYGLRFFGYEEHEILGRTLLETIVPEIDSCGRDLKQFVHNLFHDPESYLQSYLQTENENLCRDGRRVWVAWSNQAILNEQGHVVEILSVGNDITQRKQAEADLQRSETKFRNIFENSQVGIFRTRFPDGLILDVNQRFANLFGYDSPEELIEFKRKSGTDCYVHSSDREYAVESLNQQGELQNFEVQMRKRDGTVFWVLYSARLNTIDGYMEGVISDINDCKQAEAALQASETELRALFSAIPDPLFVLTAEGRVIEAVEIEPDRLYKPIEEQVGRTLHQIFAEEQADEFLGYIQQVLRTQQMLTVEYSLWMAGRKNWFSARIAPIRHEQVIWLARDITVHKQAEAASILEERNRMAREIHDTLAQCLTGVIVQLQAAIDEHTTNLVDRQAHLNQAIALAKDGLTEARRSVKALRPRLLEDAPLEVALEQLTKQMMIGTSLETNHRLVGLPYSLSPLVEEQLFRMVQEALTNVLKHANASQAEIELGYQFNQMHLRIKDNDQTWLGSPEIAGCDRNSLRQMI
jgi:PAS domain S-box-containing protein